MAEHIDVVRAEFTKQAAEFGSYQRSASKEAFTADLVSRMNLAGTEQVLEVAAGTCALGRAIAPFAAHITELDATEAMLNAGKAENEKAGINNASYLIGTAEALPFPDKAFDAVVSRLAFHHFVDPRLVCREMLRVLKPGGLIVILDMIPGETVLREQADHYETLRDPSHTKTLTREEFESMLADNNADVEHAVAAPMAIELEAWLKLTKADTDLREQITAAIEADLNGGEKTGLIPYRQNGKVFFDHHWMQLIARKR